MATLMPNQHLTDRCLGRLVVGTSTVKALLTTSAFVPNKATLATRADITNEVTGTNWPAGGVAVTATQAIDNATNIHTLTFSAINVAGTTLANIRQVVYYVANGGAASGDYVIMVVDFGSDYTTTNNPVSISASYLRTSNPN